MVAVPPDTPLTTPVVLFTVAIDGLTLVHVPPPVAQLNVVDEPTQTDKAPVALTIEPGSET